MNTIPHTLSAMFIKRLLLHFSSFASASPASSLYDPSPSLLFLPLAIYPLLSFALIVFLAISLAVPFLAQFFIPNPLSPPLSLSPSPSPPSPAGQRGRLSLPAPYPSPSSPNPSSLIPFLPHSLSPSPPPPSPTGEQRGRRRREERQRGPALSPSCERLPSPSSGRWAGESSIPVGGFPAGRDIVVVGNACVPWESLLSLYDLFFDFLWFSSPFLSFLLLHILLFFYTLHSISILPRLFHSS